VVQRFPHRFGGIGTIVTLGDGRAFTAAHCLAAVDGRCGVVVEGTGRRWRVVRRWSPKGTDLAVLRALDLPEARTGDHGTVIGPTCLAGRSLVRPGVQVSFVGHSGRQFQTRAATIIAVTSTTATSVVEHPTGVCANDSGGPVFAEGVLVGIVTHRTGPPQSAHCSRHMVFTRLDSPEMRSRVCRAYRGFAQQIAPRSNAGTAADV